MKRPACILMGVTGNSGCGQSTAAGYLREMADGVCSLDSVGHRLLDKSWVRRELSELFGRPDLLGMRSSELRPLLGRIVFTDRERLLQLNAVVHPRMAGWVRTAAHRLGLEGGIWVLEGALIFELGLERYLHSTIAVTDTFERCARRLSLRDGVPEKLTAARWKNQLPILEKASRADHVVNNSGSREYLKERILHIFQAAVAELRRTEPNGRSNGPQNQEKAHQD